jgi:hypothetical protein
MFGSCFLLPIFLHDLASRSKYVRFYRHLYSNLRRWLHGQKVLLLDANGANGTKRPSAHLMLCEIPAGDLGSRCTASRLHRDRGRMIGQVKFQVATCQSDAPQRLLRWLRRRFVIGFGLSSVLLSLTIFALRASPTKKEPLLINATVHEGQADSSGIPPGVWIEYDPVEEGYTYCYYWSGLMSCSRSFKTRERAIRDAQLFAGHLH